MAEVLPIDVERLRRTFEDDGVLAELYSMYVHDTSQRLVDLRAALDARDASRIKRAGHTLKGSSANIGAGVMREVAAELERTSVHDNSAQVAELVGALEHEFRRVERFLNEFIARAQSLT